MVGVGLGGRQPAREELVSAALHGLGWLRDTDAQELKAAHAFVIKLLETLRDSDSN